MQYEKDSPPVVLAIGGHDPGGGAGIQADVEAIAANGAHAATLITCLTVQDSCDVRSLHPVAPDLLARQADLLLADMRVATIKIGLLGSPEIAAAVSAILRHLPQIPVVLDPVLAAGGGSDLAEDELLERLREQLLPRSDLITPNIPEALRLSGLRGDPTLDDCAHALLKLDARAVLITGTHEPRGATRITHRLYRPEHPPRVSHWQRLPGDYHGSGCTLAAAVAARLARGEPLELAVDSALDYTWRTLQRGFRCGRCQAMPDRLFRYGRSKRIDDG
jgi:hydroxymethylpyrimidine/phosphomethylpyrimidine kinase